MMHRTAVNFATLAVSAFMLAACSSILPKAKAEPRQYTLSGVSLPAPVNNTPALSYSLEIQRPSAAPGLESDHIAHQTSPYRLEYLADARWASPTPALIQNALVESFTRANALSAVSGDEAAMQADYSLALDLQEFQLSSISGAPQAAKLRLTARVMSLPSRKVLRMQSFESAEPVEKLDMEALAAAFQNGYNKLTPQLLEFTLATIRQNPPAPEEVVPVKKTKGKTKVVVVPAQ